MQTVQITASTDMSNWQTIAWLQPSQFVNNVYQFTDTTVNGATPKKYYRASIADACCSPQTLGFVNIQATGTNSYTMAARPLVFSDNRVSTLIASPVDGMIVYKWDTSNQGWTLNNYAFSQWSDPNMTINYGEGYFLYKPGSSAYTIRMIGHVESNDSSLQTQILAGDSLIGSKIPLSTTLSSSALPQYDGNQIFLWNEGTQSYDSSTYFGGNWNPNLNVSTGHGFIFRTTQNPIWQQSLVIPCYFH